MHLGGGGAKWCLTYLLACQSKFCESAPAALGDEILSHYSWRFTLLCQVRAAVEYGVDTAGGAGWREGAAEEGSHILELRSLSDQLILIDMKEVRFLQAGCRRRME